MTKYIGLIHSHYKNGEKGGTVRACVGDDYCMVLDVTRTIMNHSFNTEDDFTFDYSVEVKEVEE